MKILLAGAALAAALSTPVQAQDVSRPRVRVEAHAGWDHLQNGDYKENGVLYGVGAGVDLPFGRALFVGVDANVENSSGRTCERDAFVSGDRLCIHTGRDLGVGGRLGTQLVGGARLYVLGAYSNARLRVTYRAPGYSDREGSNLDGWRVGAGGELPLTARTFVKAEYRYSNYEGGFSRHQIVGGAGLRF